MVLTSIFRQKHCAYAAKEVQKIIQSLLQGDWNFSSGSPDYIDKITNDCFGDTYLHVKILAVDTQSLIQLPRHGHLCQIKWQKPSCPASS